ncbi:TIGR04104 family putative zinc finger protein [Alkalicoccobacillus gibsonii]|uniref:TIGR04104 family putative zinc finger protein n=1 Tax=Alkalicoccobacillus gibsonii TaxID=79881 RepID=UPI003515A9F5
MPTCKHCGTQWTWWQTLKRSFTISPGLPCPNCEKEQFVTKRSKKKTAVLSFIFPMMIPVMTLTQASLTTIFIFYPSLFIIVFSIYPFLMELSNKEEFMF